TPDPIGQQARWLEQLEEFDYAIEHRPGKRHGNADAMSRRPCPKRDCVCREEDRSGGTMSVKWGLAIFGGPADRTRSPSPGCTERVEDLSDSGGLACKFFVNTCVVVADVHRGYERS